MNVCVCVCVHLCIYVCVYVCIYVCIRKIKSVIKFRHFLRTVEECIEKYLVTEETQNFKKFSNFFYTVLHGRNICTHKMGSIISGVQILHARIY